MLLEILQNAIRSNTMITVLAIFSVLFTAALMGYLGTRKAVQKTAESDFAGVPQPAIAKRWSTPLIVLAVVYCFLLLAGLSWAGWFRVA
jgi:hypothetical protein